MSSDNGRNPMRWVCAERGCFNIKKRPKIELFADCLPRRIAFTDVDGLVEINGNLLFLEWKEHIDVGQGQRILFAKLTRHSPAVVFVIEGDAETMQVRKMATVMYGKMSPFVPMDLEGLRKRICDWATWADDRANAPTHIYLPQLKTSA